MNTVSIAKVSKQYRLDDVKVPALHGIDAEIFGDRFTVLSGPSGSGKTTLLNLIAGIDRPDEGEVIVAGVRIGNLSDNALSDFRARSLGFIFQSFNLLPVLTVFENIEYPLVLANAPRTDRRDRVLELLAAVGLEHVQKHLPGQLSGGQRQRVAIARALAVKPKFVLADEPTANLDSQTGANIIELMRRMQTEEQTAFIFSSHDPHVLAAADDAIYLSDGAIVSITRRGSAL